LQPLVFTRADSSVFIPAVPFQRAKPGSLLSSNPQLSGKIPDSEGSVPSGSNSIGPIACPRVSKYSGINRAVASLPMKGLAASNLITLINRAFQP
jgi:hypothetical protein